ncbi:hypothetical protein Tco_0044504 [Tanacetum coccineum]
MALAISTTEAEYVSAGKACQQALWMKQSLIDYGIRLDDVPIMQPREEKKSFRQRDEKKGKSDWKCFRCDNPNDLIGDCPKPSRNKDQKAFIRGSWSDSENDAEDKTKDETCLMAQSSNEVTLNNLLILVDLLEKEILELNEKIKKLERSKEIEIACKSCEELKSENAKLKETPVKFVKFD